MTERSFSLEAVSIPQRGLAPQDKAMALRYLFSGPDTFERTILKWAWTDAFSSMLLLKSQTDGSSGSTPEAGRRSAHSRSFYSRGQTNQSLLLCVAASPPICLPASPINASQSHATHSCSGRSCSTMGHAGGQHGTIKQVERVNTCTPQLQGSLAANS
ncbi:hypothetical protein AGIG_G5903 [Arapaima gigas]